VASIHQEIIIDAAPEQVWDAVRDIGQIHIRLCPAMLKHAELEPDGAARIVTFQDGRVVREPILDLDDDRRRLAWAAESERLVHYSASLQIFDAGAGQARAVWIADLLPHTATPVVAQLITGNLAAMKQHLESAAKATA
jgi:uncharacterized protein YndB with AHSA1/START domain